MLHFVKPTTTYNAVER